MFPFFPGKKTQDAQTVVGELAPEKEEREFTYREFRPGNVLDLHDLEGNFLASGVSTEATPTCLTIERLPKTLRLPELEEGNQVCVRGCTAQLEGFDLQCTVAESSFKRLRLTNMHVPAVVHRRSSYRQRITVPCCVYYTDDNSKYIEGILRDISLDGCSFTAPGILPIGRRVRVQLEFYPGDYYALKVGLNRDRDVCTEKPAKHVHRVRCSRWYKVLWCNMRSVNHNYNRHEAI